MKHTTNSPPPWQVLLALILVYLAWGTTYLAIRTGVRELPPGLFGGTRILLAGALLLGYLWLRGQAITMPIGDFVWICMCGTIMFVGGNGLLHLAETSVPSGVAAVLAATFPLWLVFFEAIVPWGEHVPWTGWLGLVVGMCGVLVLYWDPHVFTAEVGLVGPLLVLSSAFLWAVGSQLYRRHRGKQGALPTAGWQMLVGGAVLTLLGFAFGEHHAWTWERTTPAAMYAYVHLLVVGSFIGFLSYLWLLNNVSAALAGTHAYVNPVVALFVGWLIADELIDGGVLLGMLVILTGVALVRVGSLPTAKTIPRGEESQEEGNAPTNDEVALCTGDDGDDDRGERERIEERLSPHTER